ncbi:hypothetical protein ACFOHU_00220 [Ottowia pentelensis]|uniref:Uncharacterized protein n=1 Tax=Ottowia pentelensis TaxID=511108 RepID=A0ABV6PPS4_9BURK
MNGHRALRAAVFGACLAAGGATPALAWKLTPEATAAERGLAAYSASRLQRAINSSAFQGVAVVGHAVHENITRRALQCMDDGLDVPGCEYDIRYQVAGVRWNDDPAFMFLPGRGEYVGCIAGQTVRMVTQPVCWARVFRHGESAAARGVRLTGANGNLLVRSHFGDLQFLHAMAIADGEAPEQTRRNVLAWAEFTWRTATGEPGFGLERVVASLPIEGFAQRFKFNRGWRIQDLFALGDPTARRADRLQRIALGSLMHVVEDSFAAGHVNRAAPVPGATCAGRADWPAPGPVVEFHSYPHQDARKHGRADQPDALAAHLAGPRPHVIDVVGTLAALWRAGVPWDDARPYLECVFALAPDARPSSAGDDYQPDAPLNPAQWGG